MTDDDGSTSQHVSSADLLVTVDLKTNYKCLKCGRMTIYKDCLAPYSAVSQPSCSRHIHSLVILVSVLLELKLAPQVTYDSLFTKLGHPATLSSASTNPDESDIKQNNVV